MRTYKICLNLPENNRFYYSELTSTNDAAQEWARTQLIRSPYLFRTHFQTKGRGQQGSGWESEAGKNLLMSLILPLKNFAIERQARLNFSVSLALRAAIQSFTDEIVSIKWPNDIYIREKKIAGILIENHIAGSSIQTSIVGMGININQLLFHEPKAISLIQISGNERDLTEVEEKVVQLVLQQVNAFSLVSDEQIRMEYNHHLYKRNTWNLFQTVTSQELGRITHVDAQGLAHFQFESGENRCFAHKEIAWL